MLKRQCFQKYANLKDVDTTVTLLSRNSSVQVDIENKSMNIYVVTTKLILHKSVLVILFNLKKSICTRLSLQ